MLNPEQIAELKEIAGEIKNIDHCYGSGLLIPFGNKVNSSRASMVFQQMPQSKNLDKPEIARVSTGYEKIYGDRSTSYYKSEKDFEIIHKIQKFDNNDIMYVLIVKERNSNSYDIIVRNEAESFAESSGIRINNATIDSKNIGDTIKTDEIIYRSNSYDEDMNYRLGINAKTLYMIDPAIVEDGYRISDKLANRLSATSINSYKIPKNNNDILLNIYGNQNIYKSFPDIGEKINDKILCVKRRVDYNNAQHLLKSKNLRKIMFGDTLFYSDGVVIDIDIFSNIPLDELPTDNSHSQINKYIHCINKYWKTIYDILGDIIEDKHNKYSDEIGMYYARARDILSIGKKVKWNDESSIFDSMIIYITTAKSSSATIGTKLVGRHGNKGVISEIVDEKFMPKSENDEYAEIIYSALSVIGRLNPSQLYEHEINWVIDEILKSNETKERKFESLLDLLTICNTDQEKIVRKMYDSLSNNEKDKFLNEITSDFVIFQPPSKSISFKNYEKIIDKFKPRKTKFTVMDTDGTELFIQQKLIMADSYILRLKHEPITKFSIRSKGTINPRTFLPIKSHSYSRGTAMFNNQAIRLGNMEMDVLQLCNDPAAINYMTRLFCTSVIGRRQFGKLLDIDVFTEDVKLDMDNSKSRVVDMFNSTFLTCGLQLKFKYGKHTNSIKDDVMENIKNLPIGNIKIMFKDNMKDKFSKDSE